KERALSPDHPDMVPTLLSLAGLCVAQGRPAEGLALARRANAVDDRLIGQIASVGSDRQRMEFLMNLRCHLEGFLSLASQHLAESTEAILAAFDLVLKRKALGAEALAVQRDAVLGGKYPALQPALQRWVALRMCIARKALAGPGPEGMEAHGQQLIQ